MLAFLADQYPQEHQQVMELEGESYSKGKFSKKILLDMIEKVSAGPGKSLEKVSGKGTAGPRAALGDISNKSATIAHTKTTTTVKPTAAIVEEMPVPQAQSTAEEVKQMVEEAKLCEELDLSQISLSESEEEEDELEFVDNLDSEEVQRAKRAEEKEMEETLQRMELALKLKNVGEHGLNAASEPMVHLLPEILEHFLANEVRLHPRPYMKYQKDIDEEMREVLVNWLCNVHMKWKLRPETIFISVNYLDRFLALREVRRTKLQLVGISALMIGCKYEEIWPPKVADFVFACDNTYTHPQVVQMERIMLRSLEFSLTVPSPLRFAEYFLQLVGYRNEEAKQLTELAASEGKESMGLEDLKWWTLYPLELSLMRYQFINYTPSKMAASALQLALRITGQKWSEEVSHRSSWPAAELRESIQALHSLLVEYQDGGSTRSYVHRKYSAAEHNSIAKAPIPSWESLFPYWAADQTAPCSPPRSKAQRAPPSSPFSPI